MKSAAEKYSDAVTALTVRLQGWGVADAETKARQFMHDMACQGWRATPQDVTPPTFAGQRPASEATRKANLELAREALSSNRGDQP